MHRSTALVFALFFTSLVAAAPVAPASVISSSPASDVATPQSIAPAAADIAIASGDILPAVVHDQSDTYSHVPEVVHSAEKSRRRSFRRRHP
ncbi:hypothetical protein DFH09DRAFT_1353069 [Mycena vulgaris]|nr:hypothetical protein DFH09DRAFT_1353069 [Mycena vulgaris]